MSDELFEEWKSLMQGLSTSFQTVEDGARRLRESVGAVDALIEKLEAGRVKADVLTGIRMGLALLEGILWIHSVPPHVEKFRTQLEKFDAMVASGELPASAHSWRHRFYERLADLEADVSDLDKRFDDVKVTFRRLTNA